LVNKTWNIIAGRYYYPTRVGDNETNSKRLEEILNFFLASLQNPTFTSGFANVLRKGTEDIQFVSNDRTGRLPTQSIMAFLQSINPAICETESAACKCILDSQRTTGVKFEDGKMIEAWISVLEGQSDVAGFISMAEVVMKKVPYLEITVQEVDAEAVSDLAKICRSKIIKPRISVCHELHFDEQAKAKDLRTIMDISPPYRLVYVGSHIEPSALNGILPQQLHEGSRFLLWLWNLEDPEDHRAFSDWIFGLNARMECSLFLVISYHSGDLSGWLQLIRDAGERLPSVITISLTLDDQEHLDISSRDAHIIRRKYVRAIKAFNADYFDAVTGKYDMKIMFNDDPRMELLE